MPIDKHKCVKLLIFGMCDGIQSERNTCMYNRSTYIRLTLHFIDLLKMVASAKHVQFAIERGIILDSCKFKKS